jgi:hypothetical protein
MFKVTHLVDPRRKVGTPRTLGLESPQTLGLESPLRQPWHSVTYHEANIRNQSIKYNKHVLYECTKRKREWFWEFWRKNHWIWSCGWKVMKVRSSRGFSANFLRKIRKLDFLELFLDGKIHGPHWPGLPWTNGHCHVPGLIRDWPPAAVVAWVVGREVEEAKGSTGVPVPGSPGLRRWRSGGASAMNVATWRAPVQVTQGLKMGKEERWEEGMLRRPFIGSEGEWGGQTSEGNGWQRWCAIMVVEAAVPGGDQPGGGGEWWGAGVLRPLQERNGCREVAAAAVSSGRKTTGWGLRVGERGRLAGWVGWQVEAQRGSGEGDLKGGEGIRAGRGWRPIGWGGESGPAGLKAGIGPTQEEEKNPFQISFKFWIWQNFGKLYRKILKGFGHRDFS